MSNSRVIPAPPAKVWAALNDPEALKASVPGCESLERVDDTTWKATVAGSATLSENRVKNSSAIFAAAASMRREPICAILPPTCALTA
jgi:carbon monoxide dehydrogenase subunit G